MVDFAGEARSAFLRNRVGLVVLHPAGRRRRGRPGPAHRRRGSSEGRWPEAISPHQPFVDVAGFDWTTEGLAARLDLAGDVFETEDQRNWTDASFKTYSTPLALPFPVPVAVGDRVHQRVRLAVVGPRHPPHRTTGPDAGAWSGRRRRDPAAAGPRRRPAPAARRSPCGAPRSTRCWSS